MLSPVDEQEQPKALDHALEGFGDEARDLPLHLARGGPPVRVRRGRAGTVSEIDADVRGVHLLPGVVLNYDRHKKSHSKGQRK